MPDFTHGIVCRLKLFTRVFARRRDEDGQDHATAIALPSRQSPVPPSVPSQDAAPASSPSAPIHRHAKTSSTPSDVTTVRMPATPPDFDILPFGQAFHVVASDASGLPKYSDTLLNGALREETLEGRKDDICNQLGNALNTSSETAYKDFFRDLTKAVVASNHSYAPYPEHQEVTPTLQVQPEFSLARLCIDGAPSLRNTAFAVTCNELYDHGITTGRAAANGARSKQHLISTPDFSCVAYNVGSTVLQSHGQSASSLSATSSSTSSSSVSRKRRYEEFLRSLEDEVDMLFCAASLVVEAKSRNLFEALCQLVAYLVQAYEISACRLGLLLLKNFYARVFLGSDNVVYLETNKLDLQGQRISMLDLFQKTGRTSDLLPHCLGKPPKDGRRMEVDWVSVKSLGEYIRIAARCLTDLPFHGVRRPHLDVSISSFTRDLDPVQLCSSALLSGASFHLTQSPEMSTTRVSDEQLKREWHATVWGARRNDHPYLSANFGSLYPSEAARLIRKSSILGKTTPTQVPAPSGSVLGAREASQDERSSAGSQDENVEISSPGDDPDNGPDGEAVAIRDDLSRGAGETSARSPANTIGDQGGDIDEDRPDQPRSIQDDDTDKPSGTREQSPDVREPPGSRAQGLSAHGAQSQDESQNMPKDAVSNIAFDTDSVPCCDNDRLWNKIREQASPEELDMVGGTESDTSDLAVPGGTILSNLNYQALTRMGTTIVLVSPQRMTELVEDYANLLRQKSAATSTQGKGLHTSRKSRQGRHSDGPIVIRTSDDSSTMVDAEELHSDS